MQVWIEEQTKLYGNPDHIFSADTFRMLFFSILVGCMRPSQSLSSSRAATFN